LSNRFHHSGIRTLKIISLNVGRPREAVWMGKTVITGIFKEPVDGPRMLRTMNIEGDAQADLSVHGGRHKAAYAYPSEHYDWWRAELPGVALPRGMFGENFTTEGMTEETVCAGDRFRIGGATVIVTQPRMPCYKLGLKFARNDMAARFLRSGRTGFYMAVEEEGPVAPGDTVELLAADEARVTIADLVRLYRGEETDDGLLRRALGVAAIPERWKNSLLEELQGE